MRTMRLSERDRENYLVQVMWPGPGLPMKE